MVVAVPAPLGIKKREVGTRFPMRGHRLERVKEGVPWAEKLWIKMVA